MKENTQPKKTLSLQGNLKHTSEEPLERRTLSHLEVPICSDSVPTNSGADSLRWALGCSECNYIQTIIETVHFVSYRYKQVHVNLVRNTLNYAIKPMLRSLCKCCHSMFVGRRFLYNPNHCLHNGHLCCFHSCLVHQDLEEGSPTIYCVHSKEDIQS